MDGKYAIGTIVNVLNEAMIDRFQKQQIVFTDIVKITNEFVDKYKEEKVDNFDQIENLIKKLKTEIIKKYG